MIVIELHCHLSGKGLKKRDNFLDEYYSLKFPGARIACRNFFKKEKIKPKMLKKVPREFERWCIEK